MSITTIQLKALPSKTKPYKKFVGNGLYIEVTPGGSKYWRFKYRFGGKEQRIALGVFPAVSLSQARDRLAEARRLLANSTNPMALRAASKAAVLAPRPIAALTRVAFAPAASGCPAATQQSG